MGDAQGISPREIGGGYQRNMREPRARNIRREASRIIRGQSPRKFLSNDDVTQANKHCLREAYSDEQAPTHSVAEDAGQSKKAAENWWNGENPQGLTAFVNNYRNNPRFAALARYYLLGHTERDPVVELQMQETLGHLSRAARSVGSTPAALAGALHLIMSGNLSLDDAQDIDSEQPVVGDLFSEKKARR